MRLLLLFLKKFFHLWMLLKLHMMYGLLCILCMLVPLDVVFLALKNLCLGQPSALNLWLPTLSILSNWSHLLILLVQIWLWMMWHYMLCRVFLLNREVFLIQFALEIHHFLLMSCMRCYVIMNNISSVIKVFLLLHWLLILLLSILLPLGIT